MDNEETRRDSIKDYEAMAMLELPDDERATLNRRLDALKSGHAALEKIMTDGVAPMVTVLDLRNILREDIMVKLLTRDEILANAPEQYDGFFKVPGTLE